jgi:hypothetical protein
MAIQANFDVDEKLKQLLEQSKILCICGKPDYSLIHEPRLGGHVYTPDNQQRY